MALGIDYKEISNDEFYGRRDPDPDDKFAEEATEDMRLEDEKAQTATCAGRHCAGIKVGEEYAIIRGKKYCVNCLCSMDIGELLELFGREIKVLTEDETDEAIEIDVIRNKRRTA